MSIKLTIAEPCHENWNRMLPEEKGRFCLSCQKTVVDFTNMSDSQVFDYFKSYQGTTCGQFSNDQLNRELNKPKTHSIGRWKYFWQILLPLVFSLHKVQAQPQLKGKVAVKPTCKVDTTEPVIITMGMVATKSVKKSVFARIISGKIVNDQKEPVPFASVISSDGKAAVAADSSGKFSISLRANASLTLSAVGYKQRQFSIDSIKPENIKALRFENNQPVIETEITMEMQEAMKGEVVVTGYGTSKRYDYDMVGGITMVRSKTMFSNVKVVAPARNAPQLKIFPNPIQPGQNFQIAFQVKKAGNYVLKIVDAAGKMIIEKKINLLSTNQTETINGSSLQQAGIYFISLNSPADKKGKVLSGRIVVQ